MTSNLKGKLNMKKYFGTKKLNAQPMTRGDYNKLRGWKMPENEKADDDGYLVEYLDGGAPNLDGYTGYVSWSPKDVFEKAYKLVSAMSFGHALEAMKTGSRVTRAGWNGKGQFLYYVPANTYAAQTEAAKKHFGESVPYRAYIAIKTAQGDVVPWVASQSDILSDDWQEIED